MDSEFGKGILLQYITTEGPILQRVVQELYTESKFKPGPASFLIWGEATMVILNLKLILKIFDNQDF